MSRYLVDAEKHRTLLEWQARRHDLQLRGLRGGTGGVDAAIVPWVDRVNAIRGVCTLQSCSGHRPSDSDNPEVGTPGQLWMALSYPMATAINQRMYELVAAPTVIRVLTRYQPYGQDVLDVMFVGDDRGGLARSMTAIIEFLLSATEAA